MRESLRNSGIDIIGDVPWGTHFCQLYQTKEVLVDILVPYFKKGLENNEFCMWVTSKTLEVADAKKVLRIAIPDLDIYLRKGQIAIIPYTSWCLKEDIFDSKRALNEWVEKINHALDSGYDGLRFGGNLSWMNNEDWNRLVEYEKLIDKVLSKYQTIALCTYSLNECNATEIIDVIANHQFALVKKEREWERIEHSGPKNITGCKREDDEMRQSGQRVRLNLENTLSPDREMLNLELAEIVDIQAFQSLMEDFYKLTHIPIGLNDLKGNVLIGVGWQDICTKFHRVHPETCKHCVESNTKLSAGVPPGEFKLHKCKNNMWDAVTPIMVSGQHVGNIFAGQFFFDDEPLDYELFRSQARKYGFKEEEYIAALEKVPRLSREAVETGMSFFMTFANMLSHLNYSNVKLTKSLLERDTLLEALRKSESKYLQIIETAQEGVWIIDRNDRTVFANKRFSEMLGYSIDEIMGQTPKKFLSPEFRSVADDRLREHRQRVKQAIDYRFIKKDGSDIWCIVSTHQLFDDEGKYAGSLGMLTDITNRKQAEEALRLSNIYNRSLIEASLDPLVTIGRDGKITDVNGATEQVTGYSRSELIGTDFSDYFTEPQKAQAGYQQVFTDGKVWDYPLEIRHKDGYITPVLYNASVYRDESDEAIGVFAAARDITERKKAEKALKKANETLEEKVKERTADLEQAYLSLKESEEGLAEAQRMAQIGNWKWNLVTDEKYWSDEVYRIFGLKPKESEVTYDTFLSYVHPDDRNYVANATKEAFKGKPYSINFRIILADGEERIVHEEGEIVFDEKSVPIRMKGTIQNITEFKKAEEALRESEARLRRFYESDMFGVLYYNLDDSITDANNKFLEIVGYTREDLQAGKVNWDTITPREYRLLDEKCIKELKTIGVKEPQEKEYVRKDGSRIPIIIGIATFDHARGEGIAFVLDITERKKTEKALAEMDRIRIKEIHHRIKNNLQVISSLLDLQAEKFTDKEVLEAFKESQNRVLSMSLIHEELYKGEGAEKLDFSAYLRKLAENLFKTYTFSSKNVHMYTDLEENAFFDMDTAVPLGIIVNELVSNSLKHAFTENQEGEIRIQLCREGKNNEIRKSLFSLTISDNGKGIPEIAELESLESLGLQLVHILVDQLDGEIVLKREHGTEFRINFKMEEKDYDSG